MPKLEVFISYSHDSADTEYLDRFLHHLKNQAVEEVIEAWHDTRIKPGQFWPNEIDSRIDRVDAAVLLVSPTFLSSPFIRNKEVPRFLERDLPIHWLLLHPCNWDILDWLKDTQGYQTDGVALSLMDAGRCDEVFVKVCRELHAFARRKCTANSFQPAATIPAANSIHDIGSWGARNIDAKKDPASEIVHRFSVAEEPPIPLSRESQASCSIGPERGYRMTRYMLRNERFQHFLALDLAFERWAELAPNNKEPTFNIYDDLLAAIKKSLEEPGKCKDFRRILVKKGRKKSKSEQQILQTLLGHETPWHFKHGIRNETRILTYPTGKTPEEKSFRDLISQLHDFTLFKDVAHAPETGVRRGSTDFAIIETSLKEPGSGPTSIEDSRFELTVDPARIFTMEMNFSDLWEKSQRICECLK